jgi:hypothetical protein
VRHWRTIEYTPAANPEKSKMLEISAVELLSMSVCDKTMLNMFVWLQKYGVCPVEIRAKIIAVGLCGAKLSVTFYL